MAPQYSGNINASIDGNLEELDPLQQAFEELGATQCGFCIPGMIMQAKALLILKPKPTREDVTKALARNLCRCTGYIKIVDAVLYAAELMGNGKRAKRKKSGNGHHAVGESVPRLDSPDKVRGVAKYAADFKMKGMLHAKILRSPHHHANILSIDTSQAESMAGVEAAVTFKDIPGRVDTPTGRPQPQLFSQDKVRFMGEGVAAVAAISEEIAKEALTRIKVDYEPLPAVFDPVMAIRDDAPQLYPPYKNVIEAVDVVQGDVEKGFAEADVIVESTYNTPPWEHAAMEQEAALAYLDEGNRVVVRTALHHFFPGRDWLAAMLALEKDQVRVICQAMGGNFGMRGDFIHAGVASLLALKTKKPVKLEYTRMESILGSSKSHSYHMKYKSGATKDGKLTAVQVEYIADGGCYIPHPEVSKMPSSVRGMATFVTGPYDVPNAHIKIYEACTNRPRSSPLRGTSMPQLAFAWDSQMDQLAAKLGMDPMEFRLRNAVNVGFRTVTGQTLDESVGAKPTLEALKGPYAEALARAVSDPPPYPWKRGLGLSCVWKGFGGDRDKGVSENVTEGTTDRPERGPFGGAEGNTGTRRAAMGWSLGRTGAALEILENGRVLALAGAVEKGQGITTVIAQIAAEALGIPLESMDVIVGDTFLAPYPTATNGQRTTFYVGGAIVNAALDLKQAMVKAAGEILEEYPDKIVLQDGYAYSSRFPREKLSLEQLAAHLKNEGIPTKYEGYMVFEKTESAEGPVFSYASQLSEVDVNMETGQVKVRQVVFAADAGTIINPLAFEGQVEGGVMHGLGFALKEKFVPGETIALKTLNIPTILDAPEKVTTLSAGQPVAGGPFGAKGMGTTIVCPPVPATINAIANAIGVRVYDLPATPDKVLEALGKK